MSADETKTPPRRGLAIALSSSFFGFFAHASFMASLHEAGIFPEQIAGTSSGALAAVLCGAGLKGAALERFVLQRGMRRCLLDWGALLRFPGVIMCLYGSGIFSGNNAVKFLRARLEGADLEHFTNPRVQIAVTNLTRREQTIIDHGDAAEWVVASSAVPVLFRNRVIDEERWCDGGIANDSPFEHWLADESVDTILIHRIQHIRGTEMGPKWPTIASGIAESHDVITRNLHRLRQRAAERSGKRIIEVVTHTVYPGLMPGRKRSLMMAHGRQTGLQAVELLKANGVALAGI
jgi:NTE family protein